jgi:hypothetical protein
MSPQHSLDYHTTSPWPGKATTVPLDPPPRYLQRAMGVLRQQATPPVCLMKHLLLSLQRRLCSSPATELMSEDAILEERPGQNRRKRDTCSGQRKFFVRQCVYPLCTNADHTPDAYPLLRGSPPTTQRVLPWDMADDSINQLRTRFEMTSSSTAPDRGCMNV